MVTVVLEARGFTDLLDRADFIKRISDQNETIVTRVRGLSHEVGLAEKRLHGLEVQATDARNAILSKRNEIAGAKQTLVSRQSDLLAARDVRAQALAKIRTTRHTLEDHLGNLQAQQARIQAKLQNASSGINAGPIRRGSGQFIWPVNGPITSGFGVRNIGAGSEFHPGIDIGAATGTPIRAAGAGTVTLMQPESASGGYGNFTCISHTSSISTCYGHQSRFGTSSGAHVSQGQVIGYVGCTGRCFGPHLHFEVRVNGAVVNPLGYL
jgi:murein DD-endopeptidase MepM/ murein hydrolase activator NlpD